MPSRLPLTLLTLILLLVAAVPASQRTTLRRTAGSGVRLQAEAAGNVVATRSAEGRTATYGYDELNRQVQQVEDERNRRRQMLVRGNRQASPAKEA